MKIARMLGAFGLLLLFAALSMGAGNSPQVGVTTPIGVANSVGPQSVPGFPPMQRGSTGAVTPVEPFNWLDFDGVDDNISIVSSDLPYGNASRSVEAWIAMTADTTHGGNERVWNMGNILNDATGFNLSGELGAWLCFYPGPAGFHYGANIPYPGTRFLHTVVTHDGSIQRLYVDGVEVASSTVGHTLNTTALDRGATPYLLRLGSDGSYVRFNGKFSRMRVYDIALSPSQVVNGFNEPSWWDIPDHCLAQIKIGTSATSIYDEASPTRSINIINGPLTWGTGR